MFTFITREVIRILSVNIYILLIPFQIFFTIIDIQLITFQKSEVVTGDVL